MEGKEKRELDKDGIPVIGRAASGGVPADGEAVGPGEIPEATPGEVDSKEEVVPLFGIAIMMMPDGQVQFMDLDTPTVYKAKDHQALALLDSAKRHLEQMILIATMRKMIGESTNIAATVGTQSALNFLAKSSKGKIIQ